MMGRRWPGLLVMLAVLASGPSMAAPGDTVPRDTVSGVVVRTSIDPKTPVVGQHVALLVDVLFPDSMPRPPSVTIAQATGAQIFRFESQGTTEQETIAGRPYVGQRFEFALYPRRAGRLAVPPASVTLFDLAGTAIGTATGEALHIDVTLPPGLDPAQPVIASPHVMLGEAWAPNATAPLKVGDALVRTVTRQAEDVPGLGFAPLSLVAPEGVRVYGNPPQSDDRVERGAVTGLRTDRLTYVFERSGDYTLPAISQRWWDLTTGSLATAESPARRVVVSAVSGTSHSPVGWCMLLVLAMGVVGLLAWVALRWGRTWWSRPPSEAALFRRLKRDAAGGDPAATYRALRRWRDALAREHPSNGVDKLPMITRLDRCLFDGDGAGQWGQNEAARLLQETGDFRRGLRHDRHRHQASTLPALNPSK